jgi:hypothetical protein
MGTFGIIDASSNYIPTQTIVSGSNNVKYKTTLGINTHAPRIDNYVVDINGPVHMTNGEVTNVSSNTDNTETIKYQEYYFKITNNFGTVSITFRDDLSQENTINSVEFANLIKEDGYETPENPEFLDVVGIANFDYQPDIEKIAIKKADTDYKDEIATYFTKQQKEERLAEYRKEQEKQKVIEEEKQQLIDYIEKQYKSDSYLDIKSNEYKNLIKLRINIEYLKIEYNKHIKKNLEVKPDIIDLLKHSANPSVSSIFS